MGKQAQRLVLIIMCLTYLLPPASSQSVLAQALNGRWIQPVNISNAGSSSNPGITVSENGTIHIIWLDEFLGYRYTQSTNGADWAAPTSVNFPFDEYPPRLVRGAGNSINAFWQDEDDNLYVSRVKGDEFGNGMSWGKSILLANETLTYSVTIDSSGVLHLIYLNLVESTNLPSGIYYRRSFLGSEEWAKPTLIYPSLYLRGVPEEQLNISIAASVYDEKDIVYVGWDENPLSKVLYTYSTDHGFTWEAPIEIDGIGNGTGVAAPFGLDLVVWRDQVIATWKRGTPESSCSILYRVSTDQGQAWSSSGTIASGLPGCAVHSASITDHPDALFWETIINNQVNLTAWDGTRWSDPQAQSELSTTDDPAMNRSLRLEQWNIAYVPGLARFVAAGTDVDGNKDIWFTSRNAADIQSWFPSEFTWKKPEAIFNARPEIGSYNLLTDADGSLHTLWLQPSMTSNESSLMINRTYNAVYYSGLKGNVWTQPVPVLQTPQGKLDHLSTAITMDNKVAAVWQENRSGALFFSWATTNRAYISAEWAEPVKLPEPAQFGSSPVIATWQKIIYVAYVIPINENRGVYLTRSSDGGNIWTKPARVFDAQSAGWELVDHPSLVVTYDGQVHVVWSKESLPGTRGSLGLYYARSTDKGDTWTSAETITERGVSWGKVITTPAGRLIQVWQEENSQNIIRSRESSDQGKTWISEEALAGSGTATGPSALFSDPAGKIYLVQFFTDANANLSLHSWENGSNKWVESERQYLAYGTNVSIRTLGAAISPKGIFTVVYTEGQDEASRVKGENPFYYTSRMVKLPEVLPTPLPPPTEVEPETTQPTVTPTITVAETQAPALPTDLSKDFPTDPGSADNSWSGLIISVGLSGILVVIGFVVLLSRKRIR